MFIYTCIYTHTYVYTYKYIYTYIHISPRQFQGYTYIYNAIEHYDARAYGGDMKTNGFVRGVTLGHLINQMDQGHSSMT